MNQQPQPHPRIRLVNRFRNRLRRAYHLVGGEIALRAVFRIAEPVATAAPSPAGPDNHPLARLIQAPPAIAASQATANDRDQEGYLIRLVGDRVFLAVCSRCNRPWRNPACSNCNSPEFGWVSDNYYSIADYLSPKYRSVIHPSYWEVAEFFRGLAAAGLFQTEYLQLQSQPR